jgi:pyruvate dehydrogenase E1 component
LDSHYRGQLSTQQALGTVLTALSRLPEVAARMVTTSPDVSISTNLGGWIQKMGVYRRQEMTNFFRENAVPLMLSWDQRPRGYHIELGISENNLFLLLNMLGLAQEFSGEALLPVGTLYDPFICRGLDALIYAAYSESKFIFAGTPSGISLSPEGGAHQSLITPSIGIELPNLVYYEPTFAQELEWIVLEGLKNIMNRKRGKIVYLRLSTRPIPQELFPQDRLKDEGSAKTLRESVLRGGYRILDYQNESSYRPGLNVVNLFTCGVLVPNAIEASRSLREENICANVIAVTSPDLLYRGWQQASQLKRKQPTTRFTFHLERLIPPAERQAPVVTVMDGHSHALSFLGSVFGSKAITLGVDDFGQSGSRNELYDHYGIGTQAMIQAAEQAILGQS